jgi:hypothetical protein
MRISFKVACLLGFTSMAVPTSLLAQETPQGDVTGPQAKQALRLLGVERNITNEGDLANRIDRHLTEEASAYVEYGRARDFTDCVARTGERRLVNLLASQPGSSDETREGRRLFSRFRSCQDNPEAFSMRLLRGASAESLLAESPLPLPRSTIQFAEFTEMTPDADDAPEGANAFYQRLAECQVAVAPGVARALLANEVNYGELEASYSQLVAATAPCGGESLEADATTALVQRSFIAEAAFHLRDYISQH